MSAHELLPLEIMLLVLQTPKEDSVKVCIAFLEECGAKLTEQQKAGNWGTCTQYFQAVCARKDVTWSADGETLCSYYGFGFECMDRYQLGGS
ncbi:unnamed protein product, partial [Mesorhabditis belari]|uniref:Uncharacterized protein n=1 Tax=Mesorhabditis belari TaxID=2138241 RepID=A0AAF3F9R1_9BILA